LNDFSAFLLTVGIADLRDPNPPHTPLVLDYGINVPLQFPGILTGQLLSLYILLYVAADLIGL